MSENGDNVIQVPDSSPVAESKTINLTSLRHQYSFQAPSSSGSSTTGGSQDTKPKLSVDVKKNFAVLRKKFPERDAKTLLSAIKAFPNLRDASKYLSELPPVKKEPALPPLRVTTPKKRSISVASSSPVEEDSPVKSMKVDLKKPAQSITQKYFNRLHLSKAAATEDPLAAATSSSASVEKRRRLIRGYRRSSSTDSSDDLIKPAELPKEPVVMIADDDEEEEDAVEDDSDEDVVEVGYNDAEDFEVKVLEFLNTAEKRDIVDIANITPAIANVFISKRPFESLEEIEDQNFTETDTPPPKKGKRKPTGLKIVESATTRLRGYNAVESLIAKCSAYSKSITTEIEKWGVGVKGEEGELEIVEVDVDSPNELPEEPDLTVVSENHENVLIKTRTAPKPRKEYSDSEADDFDDEDDEERIVVKGTRRKRGHYTGYFKAKPKMLAPNLELKGYQQVGVNWLNLLYEKELSCILADEMGLGKTVQVIAFLAHLKQKGYSGPHLVVVPSSTLENWLREFQKFCPEMVVQPYYGSQQERQSLRYELEDSSTYDVLVTTYNLATGNKYDQAFLRSRDFNVVVYDEGHMLKNSTSDRYVKLMKISADFRLLLTGTPLQNNLKELISLLSFILPSLFNAKKDDLAVLFSQKASSKIEEGEEDFNPLLAQQAIANAKTMMTPFVLRRKKSQVMKHLPEKRQIIEYCDMMDDQTQIYEKQIELVRQAREARELHKQQLKDKSVLNRTSFPLKVPTTANVLMQLRKAVLHPLLFRHVFDDAKIREMAKRIMKEPEYVDANENYIFEDMGVMSDFELQALCRKFPNSLGGFEFESDFYLRSGKIQKLKELLHEIINVRRERVLLFSLFTQMLDILESVLSILGIKFLRLDGQTAVETRQVIIDKFYSDEDIPVFLLSTRAGGFGINLVCANNVIIFDQSFNPHDDKQAEDRAHRVGQEREVNVYRLITRNTVEENIWALAQNKLQLDSSMSTTDGDDSKFEERAARMVEGMLFDTKKDAEEKDKVVEID